MSRGPGARWRIHPGAGRVPGDRVPATARGPQGVRDHRADENL